MLVLDSVSKYFKKVICFVFFVLDFVGKVKEEKMKNSKNEKIQKKPT